MANDFYEVVRGPRERERARADVIRTELRGIEVGFERLPTKNELAGAVHLLAVEAAVSAADVYVLTSGYPITKLVEGITVRFFVKNTNTGTCTVNVDATGVKDLKNIDGTVLAGREFVAGWLAEIVYNGTEFRLMNSAKSVTVGIALSSALAPQNYQRNVEIAELVLPTATGGTAPYSYAATGLPAGLAFALRTRVLSGTPTALSTSTVSYTVTDANANVFVFQFQIRVVSAVLTLPDPADRTLTVGQSYTFTLAPATGGTAPYTYSVEDLPAGLTFDGEAREVAGSPQATEIGVNPVEYVVADSGVPRQTETNSFDLTVRSAAALSLSAIADRNFVPDSEIAPFSIPSAHGGVPPYNYIVTGLNEGFSFDEKTREIRGTPSITGERVVTVRVEDSDATIVEQQFSMTIQPHGARYIAVSEDGTTTATEILTGNSYSVDAQSLKLPSWIGNRYLIIAQPADQVDLTSISLGGLGNSLSDFTKQGYTRTINGVEHENLDQ